MPLPPFDGDEGECPSPLQDLPSVDGYPIDVRQAFDAAVNRLKTPNGREALRSSLGDSFTASALGEFVGEPAAQALCPLIEQLVIDGVLNITPENTLELMPEL